MAVVIFCRACCQQRGWDRVRPTMRTTDDPCDFCGGHDVIRKRRFHPRTRQPMEPVVVNLKNFEHDDKFLVGLPAEAKLQRAVGE